MNITVEVGVLMALLANIGVIIWKSGKLEERLDNAVIELKALKSVIFTKDDANRELEIAEKEHKLIHHRIDRIEEKLV